MQLTQIFLRRVCQSIQYQYLMTIYSVCASKSEDCKLQKWAWSILIKIKVNLMQCAISKFYFENVILGPRYYVFLVKDQFIKK